MTVYSFISFSRQPIQLPIPVIHLECADIQYKGKKLRYGKHTKTASKVRQILNFLDIFHCQGSLTTYTVCTHMQSVYLLDENPFKHRRKKKLWLKMLCRHADGISFPLATKVSEVFLDTKVNVGSCKQALDCLFYISQWV